MKGLDLHLAVAGLAQVLQHRGLRVGPIAVQLYRAGAASAQATSADWNDNFLEISLLLWPRDRAG